jgi:predicted transposase YbfD/YdcC
MSSLLGLDLDRYYAELISAFSLAGPPAQAGDDWPASCVPDDTWCVQIPVLAEELAKVPDPRRAAGRRFDLVFLLLVLVMATLAGARSIAGIRRWAVDTDLAVLSALARGGATRLPAASTLSRLLARLDGDAVDDAFARYTAAVLADGDPDLVDIGPADLDEAGADVESGQDTVDGQHADPELGPGGGQGAGDGAGAADSGDGGQDEDTTSAGGRLRPVSLDGKCVRGAVTAHSRAPYLVSVYRHDTKTIAAQRQVDVKSNEITAFAGAFDVLPDLRGHIAVADALHTQRAHARYLHRRDAFYLFPVAENQPSLFAAVDALPWHTAPIAHIQEGPSHGRHERRVTKVLPAPKNLPFPDVRQVILTERTTTSRGDDKVHAVAALAITSAPKHLAGPADLAAIIRGHWGQEMVHYVRDCSYREDQSRVRTGQAARIMATARNLAISLANIAGWKHIPQANDHYRTHPTDALQLLGLNM